MGSRGLQLQTTFPVLSSSFQKGYRNTNSFTKLHFISFIKDKCKSVMRKLPSKIERSRDCGVQGGRWMSWRAVSEPEVVLTLNS